MTTEQTELIEKLNCLEFETSQLSHAYQLWRSKVEQGTAPEWMAAVIRITYDALITFCLDTVSAQALDTNHADEIESYPRSNETDPPPGPALLAEDGMTALCLHYGQRLRCDDAETDPPVRLTTLVDCSRVFTPLSQQNRVVGMLALADVPRAFSARHLEQLEAAASEISGIWREESTNAEPPPELLPMMERDWPGPEVAVAISPASTSDAISARPAIQLGRQEEEAGAGPVAIHSLATLRLPSWLQGSSTGKLFAALSVALLMIAGGVIGIYVASHQRAASILPVQNSATQGSPGIAIPNGEETELKFDRDPVVVRQGSSFVLSAVLSRGSDIASVAAQVDYDANVLQFMGASEGPFLAKAGRQVVLAQHNDPLKGVLKINAERSPGTPGISGGGPVFALSFQARKRGKGTVSIVPSAHDSHGRRIGIAGSQVSVGVN